MGWPPQPALAPVLFACAVFGSWPAAAGERLMARAVGCAVDGAEIGSLMSGLAADDPGMKTPARHLAAPSGALYRLSAPIDALGLVAHEIYVAPGRIVMVTATAPLEDVIVRLRLTPSPYGPAERAIDGDRKLIAYRLHQQGLADKVLVGCEYAAPSALTWLALDEAF